MSMDRVEEAFKRVDRRLFLPADLQYDAELDIPLPIGHGQTNSQPYTVKMMLSWLDVRLGQRVLDVGSGSGWTTALLAALVGKRGRVYAVELVPELVEFGKVNCRRAGITNAQFFEAGESLGLPAHAPYDRILVSASAQEVPVELLQQLEPNGKLVLPVKSDILEITKPDPETIETTVHTGFSFVPLLRKY